MFRFLPQVEQYKDWGPWAKELLKVLSKPQPESLVALIPYPYDRLPRPSRDGLLVFLTNDSTGAQPIYSRGGNWYRLNGTSPVPNIEIVCPRNRFKLQSYQVVITVA